MSEYSTVGIQKQEGNGKNLKDKKFDWRGKKRQNLHMADLYGDLGYERYNYRAGFCSWTLHYLVSGVDTPTETRTLHKASFCHLRCCPVCAARKAKKSAHQLTKVLDMVKSNYADSQFIFLTLTVANCPGESLADTISLLTKSWTKMIRHRPFERAVRGWFRAVEVTRNRKTGDYHPHLHAILCVENSYFAKSNKTYITHEKWVSMWKKALGVNYDPSVRVQKTTAKRKGAGLSECYEAAKYSVKGTDFLDSRLSRGEAADVLGTYTNALFGKRLVGFGGWLKDAAAELKVSEDLEQTDLIHLDDEDDIRDEPAQLVERYGWKFGVGDYLLEDSWEYDPEEEAALEEWARGIT